MTKQSRRKFTADSKSEVIIKALKERSTIEELSKKFEVQPTQINTWKREFMGKASSQFSDKGESEDKQNKLTLRSSMRKQGG